MNKMRLFKVGINMLSRAKPILDSHSYHFINPQKALYFFLMWDKPLYKNPLLYGNL